MEYSKRSLEGMSKEESEFLFIELSALQIPRDLWIVKSGLNQKKYQNVQSMHELIEKLKKDKSKTSQDIERVHHVLGFLQYMGMDYDDEID